MSSIECTLMTREDGQCYMHCEADETLCELTRQQCGGRRVPGSVMQRPPRRRPSRRVAERPMQPQRPPRTRRPSGRYPLSRVEMANLDADLRRLVTVPHMNTQREIQRELRDIGVIGAGPLQREDDLNETSFYHVRNACPCVAPTSGKNCWTTSWRGPSGKCAEAMGYYPGVNVLNRNPLARRYYRPCLESEPNCDHSSGANVSGGMGFW